MKGISSIFLAVISDNVVRKNIINGCFLCMFCSFIFLGFLCNNYICLILGYALAGLGFSSVIGVEITLALETMSLRYKDIAIGVIFSVFIIG